MALVFGLSAEKDCVVLSDAAGTSVVDSFCFEGAAVGEVYGRWVLPPFFSPVISHVGLGAVSG